MFNKAGQRLAANEWAVRLFLLVACLVGGWVALSLRARSGMYVYMAINWATVGYNLNTWLRFETDARRQRIQRIKDFEPWLVQLIHIRCILVYLPGHVALGQLCKALDRRETVFRTIYALQRSVES